MIEVLWSHFYDARYPGFNVLKLRAKSGMPVAFADFEVCKIASGNC